MSRPGSMDVRLRFHVFCEPYPERLSNRFSKFGHTMAISALCGCVCLFFFVCVLMCVKGREEEKVRQSGKSEIRRNKTKEKQENGT